jgi:transposase
VIDVEDWAEIRRLRFVVGLSIKEICRRTGRNRSTVRRAVRSQGPPAYRRPPVASKLDPHKEEIHRLLRVEPRIPATRVRELIAEAGCGGGQTILDVDLREVRPLFAPPPRAFQRTTYRPGEICQFDLWEPGRPIPVGCGQERRGWVVVACLGYSRAGAGALIFSRRAEERLQGYMETSFEPGRSFANELDFQLQLDDWFDTRANLRAHRALRCRPIDRLGEDLEAMRPLLAEAPDLDRRIGR